MRKNTQSGIVRSLPIFIRIFSSNTTESSTCGRKLFKEQIMVFSKMYGTIKITETRESESSASEVQTI